MTLEALISTTTLDSPTNLLKYLFTKQAAAEDQGNSVYDFFTFENSSYSTYEPCYDSAINYLKQLYIQYEPCQGYL